MSETNRPTAAASESAPSSVIAPNWRRNEPGRRRAIASPSSTVATATGATIASVTSAPCAS